MLNFFTKEWKNSNMYQAIVALIKQEACCVCCKNPISLPVLTTEQRDALETVTLGMIFFNSTSDTVQVYTSLGWADL